ncbi:sporulation histidine kinase inhibitor Sda [Bacillus sp. JCM 19041]
MLSELKDDLLIEACNKAIQINLEADFIELLKQEIERRGMFISN